MNELKTSSYDYFLPSNLIASHPANPVESARLLIYDRKKDEIIHENFSNLFSYIPKNTAIILNDTKVIKARIFGTKNTGGQVEVLINSPLSEDSFKVYIKGKVKINTQINFKNNLKLEVKKLFDDGTREVVFFHDKMDDFFCENSFKKPLNIQEVYEILEQIGHVPLPPYIKREDTKEDELNYQSVFAKNSGAVAAPTASLHFSKNMFKRIEDEFKHAFITLHVGAGTFKPVEVEDIQKHKMHEEFFNISNEAEEILKSDQKILAIGTTVTRVVEFYARKKKKSGWCELFLHPQNRPLRVNLLLTNFHLPKSTLLMLVASFIGIEKTLQIYNEAVKNEYRFFSYGDAMMII